jgi:hypothetical protein
VDEKQYIIDPENEMWLWSVPGVAVLSFLLIFAIRLNFIPSPFENFLTLAVLEAILLVVLLVIGILTVIER